LLLLSARGAFSVFRYIYCFLSVADKSAVQREKKTAGFGRGKTSLDQRTGSSATVDSYRKTILTLSSIATQIFQILFITDIVHKAYTRKWRECCRIYLRIYYLRWWNIILSECHSSMAI